MKDTKNLPVTIEATDPLVRVVDVRKTFAENVVLDNLSLEVKANSCVVLIGASGSGKSTLLRCIDLLETIDDGFIEVGGVDITDPRIDPNAVRSQLGMVFQSFNLFPHMKVIDNITLAPRLVHGVDPKIARVQALEILERVGLADKADALPDQLSGGQQQRAAIARSLVNSPKLMLLDEVTSALDPELVGEVLDLLCELKEEGMTMVVATHEMAFAQEVADDVCFLDSGRVLEHGSAAQVLSAPTQTRTREFLSRLHL